MKHKLLYLAMFTAGAATGAAATWQYFKKKYEKISQEEIDSVKEAFKQDNKDIPVKEEPEIVEEKTKEDVKKYNNIVTDYTKCSTEKSEVKKTMGKDGPYIISPDEFGEIYEYETVTLFYFADGYLTDDMNELVSNVNQTVGTEFQDSFGQYEDDSVFVRNDAMKCDYEILLDERNYSDVVD